MCLLSFWPKYLNDTACSFKMCNVSDSHFIFIGRIGL